MNNVAPILAPVPLNADALHTAAGLNEYAVFMLPHVIIVIIGNRHVRAHAATICQIISINERKTLQCMTIKAGKS